MEAETFFLLARFFTSRFPRTATQGTRTWETQPAAPCFQAGKHFLAKLERQQAQELFLSSARGLAFSGMSLLPLPWSLDSWPEGVSVGNHSHGSCDVPTAVDTHAERGRY